jgi:hypothetical protein
VEALKLRLKGDKFWKQNNTDALDRGIVDEKRSIVRNKHGGKEAG